jgi:hypothetical protein
VVASSLFAARDEGDSSVLVAWVTARLDLKRQAPLLGSLQLVHATSQISYLLIQCRHPSTRKPSERAGPLGLNAVKMTARRPWSDVGAVEASQAPQATSRRRDEAL